VETALAMEDAVRQAGGVPATVGVTEGKMRVGLTREEIEKLGQGGAAKVAVRDIPYAVQSKLYGGTTVSATARIACAAGINVMATGGIGGVHRDSAANDISADLWEMTRTPIVIVSSGPKAVLDVPATAEWLETHSVPVYGFQTDEMPAFYSRSTGIGIPSFDSVRALADTINCALGVVPLRTAVLVAVPIPEADEIDISKELDAAAKEAAESGIRGKDLTPWLLNRVATLTGGKSIAANTALLKNNARVAAEMGFGA